MHLTGETKVCSYALKGYCSRTLIVVRLKSVFLREEKKSK